MDNKTKLIAIEEWDEAMARLTWTPIDPYDDIEAMARLTWMPMEKRRAGHRREKRLKAGIDAAWITILCGCCFIIGLCVGGWTL